MVWKLVCTSRMLQENLLRENHSGMETKVLEEVRSGNVLRENHSGMGEDPPVAFGGQYHFVAPVPLRGRRAVFGD